MVSAAWRRLGPHLRRHHEWYWAPLAYAAAVVALYHHVFFPGDGPQQGLGWDSIEAYWPDLAYLARQLGEGNWPLWNPYERGGFPYFALPERGTYYPVNWLLAGWGAIRGETSWWVIQLKGLGHAAIAGLTMHLFLRSRGLPRAAALVGGVAWLGSAPMLIHKASSVIWPLVWIPLVWLAADRVAERPSWRTGCALAGALLLAGHAGSAPGFFYVLLAAVPYGAVRVAQAAWAARARGWRAIGDRAWAVAVGGAVTVAMMLVTVVPGLELTEMSQRAERSAGYALQAPLAIERTLVGLLDPIAGKYDVHLGVFAACLALVALVSRPLGDRGAAVVMAVIAGFLLVLSFGDQVPVLRWLVENVPGFDLFRISNRYKLPAAPALAALAGHGAAAVIDAPRAWDRRRVGAIAAAAAVVALALWIARSYDVPDDPRLPAAWLPWALALASAGAVAALVLIPRRAAAIAAAAIVPVVLWEPQHRIFATNPALEERPDNLEDRRWLEGLADVREDWRIWDEFVLEQRAGSRLGIREFRSYPASGSLEWERYRRVITYASVHPEILAAFNIRYLFYGAHHRAGRRANHIARPPSRSSPDHFRRLRAHVHEARYPAPFASWYGAIDVPERTDGGSVLDRVYHALDMDRGVRTRAILEPAALSRLPRGLAGELRAAAEDPPDPVTAEIVSFEAEEVSVRVDAPSAGVLVVNEVWYPGWEVAVDGEPAEGFIANWLVRGVAVPAGEHTVTWTFRPRHHRLLVGLFLAGLALLAAAAIRRPRR